MGGINQRCDVVTCQFLFRSNTREHEQFWRLEDSLRYDDLLLGIELHLLTVAKQNGYALRNISIEVDFLRESGRQKGDVRLPSKETGTG